MNIDPRRLAVLLAVQRAGGVVAAADQLSITPSAVSQQISRLEKEVGHPVIERTPAGAVLTAAGVMLAQVAERIEHELEQAHVELLRQQGQIVGTLTVGAFQTVIRSLLLPLSTELARSQSGIHLAVREIWEEEGRRELRRGVLDMLILERDVYAPAPVPAGANDLPLIDEPWYVVSPRVMPTPQGLSDLAGHTWLTAAPGTAAARALQRLVTSLELQTDPTHRFVDYDVALDMVEAGLGSAILPALALQGHSLTNAVATHLPGLGVRRLVVRHRTTTTGATPLMTAVHQMLRERAAALDFSSPGVQVNGA